LDNTFGEVLECELGAGLVGKFRELGFSFWDVAERRRIVRGEGERPIAEVDWLLLNEGQLMAVEVKRSLSISDVNRHIARLQKISNYAKSPNARDDWRGKTLYGAVAGVIIEKGAKEYAIEKGMFVIEPSGESVSITEPPVPTYNWEAKTE
jgi:hypothetical protein